MGEYFLCATSRVRVWGAYRITVNGGVYNGIIGITGKIKHAGTGMLIEKCNAHHDNAFTVYIVCDVRRFFFLSGR